MVAARKRENQNRINDKIYLFVYGKKILQYQLVLLVQEFSPIIYYSSQLSFTTVPFSKCMLSI